MREWTREEKYRYLKNPQEVKELFQFYRLRIMKNSEKIVKFSWKFQRRSAIISPR